MQVCSSCAPTFLTFERTLYITLPTFHDILTWPACPSVCLAVFRVFRATLLLVWFFSSDTVQSIGPSATQIKRNGEARPPASQFSVANTNAAYGVHSTPNHNCPGKRWTKRKRNITTVVCLIIDRLMKLLPPNRVTRNTNNWLFHSVERASEKLALFPVYHSNNRQSFLCFNFCSQFGPRNCAPPNEGNNYFYATFSNLANKSPIAQQ